MSCTASTKFSSSGAVGWFGSGDVAHAGSSTISGGARRTLTSPGFVRNPRWKSARLHREHSTPPGLAPAVHCCSHPPCRAWVGRCSWRAVYAPSAPGCRGARTRTGTGLASHGLTRDGSHEKTTFPRTTDAILASSRHGEGSVAGFRGVIRGVIVVLNFVAALVCDPLLICWESASSASDRVIRCVSARRR